MKVILKEKRGWIFKKVYKFKEPIEMTQGEFDEATKKGIRLEISQEKKQKEKKNK